MSDETKRFHFAKHEVDKMTDEELQSVMELPQTINWYRARGHPVDEWIRRLWSLPIRQNPGIYDEDREDFDEDREDFEDFED